MSNDTNEKITVEVDGSRASEGFGRIKGSAKEADDAIDGVGKTSDKVGGNLGRLSDAARAAADALRAPATQASDAARKLKDAGDSAEKTSSSFDKLAKSMFTGARATGGWIWDLAADGMRMAMGFAESFIDRIAGVQRTISLLNNIPGANVGDEFAFLTGVANKYGLSLQSLQNDYAKYTMSAQNSTLGNEGVKRSFEQVAMAVRTFHMSAQQAQFTFLALEQMLSKGQVSLQELRRQFSERIPGAMQALARELGVKLSDLLQFITKVGASSDKLMPFLGDALQRMTQGGITNAARALDAERNRLQTSVTLFFKRVLDAGGDSGMSNLLKALNDLLSTSTMAETFAVVMNRVTQAITDFIRSLKPEDVDQFASKVLSFLSSFVTLAVAAGRAITYLAEHLPQVGAAFGALYGMSLGQRIGGGYGALIGGVLGLGAGFVGGKAMGGPDSEMKQLNDAIADLDGKLNHPKVWDKIAYAYDPRRREADLVKYNTLTIKRDALLAGMAGPATQTDPITGPKLDPLREIFNGTPAQIKAYLQGLIGVDGKTDEKLANRQDNFLRSLLGQYESVAKPEDDKFARLSLMMKHLGISGNRMVTDEYGDSHSVQSMIDALQADFNKRKQDQSDKKTMAIESQFTNMQHSFGNEVDKFAEKYNVNNLLEVDEQKWQNDAQKMKSLLTRELDQLGTEWKKRAQDNPLFAMQHPDIEGEINQLRQWGDRYINEFKRIEQEKRSVMGGSKAFLKEWNANAQDFGKITKDFLSGVANGIVDMLTNMVMTGKLSFAKLTQFVLEYIAKMMIVQAITPFMNMATSFLSSAISGALSIGSSAGSSMYSLSNGSSGLGLKMRAAGGPVWPGEPFLVGERGPEVVTFNGPGYVHPNGSGPVGNSNVMVTVNVDASGKATASANDGGAQMTALGRLIGDKVREIIVNEQRPGGMLSHA